MARNRIGFLMSGSGGNPTGIGGYVRKLDAAGVPAVVMCNDGTVGLSDVFALWEAGSHVPHVCAYRVVRDGSEAFSVPDYSLHYRDAAVKHWEKIRPFIPAQVSMHRERVWVLPINEVDKNRADWLGNFSLEIAKLMNAEGYRCASFGWASGEPEPHHWEADGMMQYLFYCAQHPTLAAVCLHEYSYDVGDIMAGDGHLVGRFKTLFDLCDRKGINRPSVIIGEWGWEMKKIPPADVAMTHIREVSKLYAGYPQILGAGMWYLGNYQGSDIDDQTQRLIAPVTALTLDTVWPDPTPPTEPPPTNSGFAREPYDRVYWVAAGDADRRAEIYRLAAEAAVTVGPSYDDAGVGDGLASKTAVLWELPTDRREEFALWFAEHYPGTAVEFRNVAADNPVEPAAFAFEAWPTDYKVVNQRFGANSTAYQKYGLPGHEGVDIRAYHGTPIYAVADGEVVRVGDDRQDAASGGHNYGVRVYIDHADDWQTIYAHLDSRAVNVGDRVVAGQKIGTADNTGNSFGSHLHLTLKRHGHSFGEWPHTIHDPTPFLMPFNPQWPSTQPTTPPPAPAYKYTGKPVNFRAWLHQPADDWAWQIGPVQACFNQSGLKAKFMSSGISANYWAAFGDPAALVRVFWKPWVGATPERFWDEIKGDVLRFYSMGARRFELHNEPNLNDEGFGLVWADGREFGLWLSGVIDLMRFYMPDALLYFPGMSPGGQTGGVWTNQFAFTEPAWAIVASKMDGFCMHAYTVGQTVQAAHDEIVEQVVELQKHLKLQVPLIVSESSAKDTAAPYDYQRKAAAYRKVEATLAGMPGVEGICWYVSSWKSPPAGHVYASEIWEGTPLPALYAAARPSLVARVLGALGL